MTENITRNIDGLIKIIKAQYPECTLDQDLFSEKLNHYVQLGIFSVTDGVYRVTDQGNTYKDHVDATVRAEFGKSVGNRRRKRPNQA